MTTKRKMTDFLLASSSDRHIVQTWPQNGIC